MFQLLLIFASISIVASADKIYPIEHIDTTKTNTNSSFQHNPDLRNFWRDTTKRWPRGQIPYTLSGDYTDNEAYIIKLAMYEWESKTCIRFIPATSSHRDYVLITPTAPDVGAATYCYCAVGKQSGKQVMRMYGECIRKAAMVHELGHLIGMNHEHQRPDRDYYVKVNLQNVKPAYKYAFDKFTTNQVLSYWDGYDYDTSSVMQYPYYAFALYPNDPKYPSMTLLDGTFGPLATEKENLSKLDITKIQKYYNGCQ